MSGPNPKDHGLGQQIEGYYEPGRPVVVIEDLHLHREKQPPGRGGLRQADLDVIGLVSIFNYNFPAARTAFQQAGVPYLSLSDYPTLISLALDKKLVSPEEEAVLLKWSEDPAGWKGSIGWADFIAYFYNSNPFTL